MERIYEHMWLFKMRKEGDPNKQEANSVLWNHSKQVHNSTMTTSNWKVEVTSSHKTALSRQMTEAVRISREPKDNILNSKNEFGANTLPEIALKYGSLVVTKPQMRSKENGTNFKRKSKEEEAPPVDDIRPPELHSAETEDGQHLVVGGQEGIPPSATPSEVNGETTLEHTTPAGGPETEEATAREEGNEGDTPESPEDPSTGETATTTTTITEGGNEGDGPRSPKNLQKNTSTPTKTAQEAKGKLPIDFGSAEMQGSAATPLPSSPEGSGVTPPDSYRSGDLAKERAEPSPRPNVPKKRRLCPPKQNNYASMNKNQLKNILRAKYLQVGGNRDDLIERLEKADRGQATMKFSITVPPNPYHPPPPNTPKRKRHNSREENEDDDSIHQSQKEARVELKGDTNETQFVTGLEVRQVQTKGDPGGGIHLKEDVKTFKEDREGRKFHKGEHLLMEQDARQEIISSSSKIINRDRRGPEIIKTSSQNHPT